VRHNGRRFGWGPRNLPFSRTVQPAGRYWTISERVAVWILDVEIGVAVRPVGVVSGTLNAARAQVAPHRVGVGGFHRDVAQAVAACLRFGHEFDCTGGR
jgi:hypothetical protein